jgi:phospholipid-binding lipoprotein MlaA
MYAKKELQMVRILAVVVFLVALIATLDDASASDTSSQRFLEKETGMSPSASFSPKNREALIVAMNSESLAFEDDEFEEDLEPIETIADPYESYNRFIHGFNDKFYFYALKPTAKGYGKIMPQKARVSIQNFFYNLYAPVRIVNCALQGDGESALNEVSRFAINTTVGAVGFFDPATSWFNLETQEEDFGQTLGRFKGPGFYISNPFLGPSSLRDSVGMVIDLFIVPSWYILWHYNYYYTGAKAFEILNRTSLRIGEYEALKDSALDPYVSVRDAYFQYRENLIKR